MSPPLSSHASTRAESKSCAASPIASGRTIPAIIDLAIEDQAPWGQSEPNQWCDFSRDRKCVDRSACVWCYDRLGAHPGGVKLVNLTSSHLARKMARRDKRHRRSGRPVVQHDIQKTRFIKNLKRGRPACEATAEGCTPEQMERWAGIS